MTDVDENGVDRIDRFRAYSQRFIQYSVTDEVYSETLKYMLQLRAERDEARREVCEWVALQTGRYPRVIASNRDWNCFAKEEEQ